MSNAFSSSKQVPLVSESSSPKQMSLVSESSSAEQIQIEFTPLILASEPISVSSGSPALLMLPVEILLKIGGFSDIRTVLNLIATCKYIRNQSNTWFLQKLASESNPDRATSGFIIDSIGDKGDTCLWRNAKFFIRDHDIPKDLSIHLFANKTAEKISSDEVRSMIIQSYGLPSPYNPYDPSDSHHDIRKFLKFLFSKVSFKNLKCLMFCGIELSMEFPREIGALNLDVFHMRNFRYQAAGWTYHNFFRHWNSLKTLYVVHSGVIEEVHPPGKLEKLVIYCPKSSKNVIDEHKIAKLLIDVNECHALKET